MLKAELQGLLENASKLPVMEDSLRHACDLRAGENGVLHNSLSGACLDLSRVVAESIRSVAPDLKPIQRVSLCHTCIEYPTDDQGIMVVDPTLGQFILWDRIFLGSEEELRRIFLDCSRKFLWSEFQVPIEVQLDDRTIPEGTPMSRRDWFDFIYQPLYRHSWFTLE